MTLRYMAFNVPVVFDFLEKHGHVLTVRGYDYTTEFAKVANLGNIHRVKVCEITTESDLNGFVALSGFKSAREWSKQINIFCKGRKWLYRVQLVDEGLSKPEIARDEREQQREFERQNAWSNEDEIVEILSHPLDIRTDAALRDPALIDLQPFKDAARADRVQKQEEATARKHERMREMYGEQTRAAPTQEVHNPDKIKAVSIAERALKALCAA